LLTSLLTWAAPTKPTAPTLAIGKPAPNFKLTGSDSKTYQLKDYRGKLVVLEWTNAQCPFVQKHYDSGNMQKLQKQAAKDGVVWLSIISSAPGKQGYVTPKEANAIVAKEKAAPSAVLLDPTGKVGRLYKATNTPGMYIIDKQGKLAYMGAIDNKPTAKQADVAQAHNYVAAALNELEQGKSVTDPVTPPYGCSIKYAG
jgi:peroxiredoxin